MATKKSENSKIDPKTDSKTDHKLTQEEINALLEKINKISENGSPEEKVEIYSPEQLSDTAKKVSAFVYEEGEKLDKKITDDEQKLGIKTTREEKQRLNRLRHEVKRSVGKALESVEKLTPTEIDKIFSAAGFREDKKTEETQETTDSKPGAQEMTNQTPKSVKINNSNQEKKNNSHWPPKIGEDIPSDVKDKLYKIAGAANNNKESSPVNTSARTEKPPEKPQSTIEKLVIGKGGEVELKQFPNGKIELKIKRAAYAENFEMLNGVVISPDIFAKYQKKMTKSNEASFLAQDTNDLYTAHLLLENLKTKSTPEEWQKLVEAYNHLISLYNQPYQSFGKVFLNYQDVAIKVKEKTVKQPVPEKSKDEITTTPKKTESIKPIKITNKIEKLSQPIVITVTVGRRKIDVRFTRKFDKQENIYRWRYNLDNQKDKNYFAAIDKKYQLEIINDALHTASQKFPQAKTELEFFRLNLNRKPASKPEMVKIHPQITPDGRPIVKEKPPLVPSGSPDEVIIQPMTPLTKESSSVSTDDSESKITKSIKSEVPTPPHSETVSEVTSSTTAPETPTSDIKKDDKVEAPPIESIANALETHPEVVNTVKPEESPAVISTETKTPDAGKIETAGRPMESKINEVVENFLKSLSPEALSREDQLLLGLEKALEELSETDKQRLAAGGNWNELKGYLASRYFTVLKDSLEKQLRLAKNAVPPQTTESKPGLWDKVKKKVWKGNMEELNKLGSLSASTGIFVGAIRLASFIPGVGSIIIGARTVAGIAAGAANYGINRIKRSKPTLEKHADDFKFAIKDSRQRQQIWQQVRNLTSSELGAVINGDADRLNELTRQEELLDQIKFTEVQDEAGILRTDSKEEKKAAIAALLKQTKETLQGKTKTLKEGGQKHSELLTKARDSKALDDFLTGLAEIDLKQFQEDLRSIQQGEEMSAEVKQKLSPVLAELELNLERQSNALLADVVAQEKLGGEKGKEFFKQLYDNALFGGQPPDSIWVAMAQGAVTGAIAGTASHWGAGAVYGLVRRGGAAFMQEMAQYAPKGEQKTIKTPVEIQNNLRAFLPENTIKLDNITDLSPQIELAKKSVQDARARIKLPDIKEGDRALIEKDITNLTKKILQAEQLIWLNNENQKDLADLEGRLQRVSERINQTENIEKQAEKLLQKGQEAKKFSRQFLNFFKLSKEDKIKVLTGTAAEAGKGLLIGAAVGGLVGLGFDKVFGAEHVPQAVTTNEQGPDILQQQEINNLNQYEQIFNTQLGLTDDTAQHDFLESYKSIFPTPDSLQNAIDDINKHFGKFAPDHQGNLTHDILLAAMDKAHPTNYQELNVAIKDVGQDIILKDFTTDADNKVFAQLDAKPEIDLENGKIELKIEHIGSQGRMLEQVMREIHLGDNKTLAEILDQTKEGQKNITIDTLDASRDNNVAANLVALLQGKHYDGRPVSSIAGITPEEMKTVAEFDDKNDTLHIRDEAEFREVLHTLHNHAAEIITEKNLPQQGATAYVGNVDYDHALTEAGAKDAQTHLTEQFDAKIIDTAREYLVEAKLDQCGLENIVDKGSLEFTHLGQGVFNEGNLDFSVHGNTIHVEHGNISAIDAGSVHLVGLNIPLEKGWNNVDEDLMDKIVTNRGTDDDRAQQLELAHKALFPSPETNAASGAEKLEVEVGKETAEVLETPPVGEGKILIAGEPTRVIINGNVQAEFRMREDGEVVFNVVNREDLDSIKPELYENNVLTGNWREILAQHNKEDGVNERTAEIREEQVETSAQSLYAMHQGIEQLSKEGYDPKIIEQLKEDYNERIDQRGNVGLKMEEMQAEKQGYMRDLFLHWEEKSTGTSPVLNENPQENTAATAQKGEEQNAPEESKDQSQEPVSAEQTVIIKEVPFDIHEKYNNPADLEKLQEITLKLQNDLQQEKTELNQARENLKSQTDDFEKQKIEHELNFLEKKLAQTQEMYDKIEQNAKNGKLGTVTLIGYGSKSFAFSYNFDLQ